MTIIKARSLAATIALLGALGSPSMLHAQMGVGTWVRQASASMSSMTMKVEACCGSGRRLTYHIGSNATAMVQSGAVVTSPNAAIAFQTGSTSSATVDGAGS